MGRKPVEDRVALLESRMGRLERIIAVSQVLTSTLNLERLLETSISIATELTGTAASSLLLLDRQTGELECNYDVSMEEQGRIFAMSVKQAIIGRVREAERDVIYDEFEQKLGDIVSGTVQRFEGDTVIVNLGRNLEGILPRAAKEGLTAITKRLRNRVRPVMMFSVRPSAK